MPAFCITAKNESATIGKVVADIRSLYNSPIIVVDDGSSDETARIAQLAGAVIIHHTESRGIGPSLLEAWTLALKYEPTHIVQLDAGGSHDAKQSCRLLSRCTDVGMVIGSRFVPGAQYVGNQKRAWCSRRMADICNLLQGGNIHDWTSGYRVYRTEVIQYLLRWAYQAKMHAWQMEVLGRVRYGGFKVTEVPIQYRSGESSLRIKHLSEIVTVLLGLLNHMQVYK